MTRRPINRSISPVAPSPLFFSSRFTFVTRPALPSPAPPRRCSYPPALCLRASSGPPSCFSVLSVPVRLSCSLPPVPPPRFCCALRPPARAFLCVRVASRPARLLCVRSRVVGAPARARAAPAAPGPVPRRRALPPGPLSLLAPGSAASVFSPALRPRAPRARPPRPPRPGPPAAPPPASRRARCPAPRAPAGSLRRVPLLPLPAGYGTPARPALRGLAPTASIPRRQGQRPGGAPAPGFLPHRTRLNAAQRGVDRKQTRRRHRPVIDEMDLAGVCLTVDALHSLADLRGAPAAPRLFVSPPRPPPCLAGVPVAPSARPLPRPSSPRPRLPSVCVAPPSPPPPPSFLPPARIRRRPRTCSPSTAGTGPPPRPPTGSATPT